MKMSKLKKEGYWYSVQEPLLPMPVPVEYMENKANIIRRLQRIEETKVQKLFCKGSSKCRLCGDLNGSAEHAYNGWLWPQGLLHYVEDHNVPLSKEFLRDVLNLVSHEDYVAMVKHNPEDSDSGKLREECL